MLAGEDIPHLLQTLLVGVEHAICRVPLDELTFPTQYDSNVTVSNSSDKCESDCTTQLVDKLIESNSKHRELITKNNSINKKYISASKRITSNGILHENGISNTNDDIEDDEINNLTEHLTTFDDGNLSIMCTSSTLPLFCLGGSFPHIDSDEESGDDSRKIQSGKIHLFFIIIIFIHLHISKILIYYQVRCQFLMHNFIWLDRILFFIFNFKGFKVIHNSFV
jgi:hypothetical protein